MIGDAVRSALAAAVSAGYDNSWTMPREVYTDPEVLSLERSQ